MAEETTIDLVKTVLFSDSSSDVFAVLDGALIDDLLPMLREQDPVYKCLFAGKLEPAIGRAAPYLVRLEPDHSITDWVIAKGWGNHWGVFIQTHVNLAKVRRSLRKFLLVRDPEGKLVGFRWYDPRVLREYLPTCNHSDVQTIFASVDRYLLESKDPGVMYSFDGRAAPPILDEIKLTPDGVAGVVAAAGG